LTQEGCHFPYRTTAVGRQYGVAYDQLSSPLQGHLPAGVHDQQTSKLQRDDEYNEVYHIRNNRCIELMGHNRTHIEGSWHLQACTHLVRDNVRTTYMHRMGTFTIFVLHCGRLLTWTTLTYVTQ
jgi:hypothetical protein